jgi:rRNA maturation endonuclease Nob1
MGEFADYAIDNMMDVDELQLRYDTFNEAYQAGVEELLYDYQCGRLPHVFSSQPSQPSICPKCGGTVVNRTNRTTCAKFLGCGNFPNCKWSCSIK